MSEIEIYNDSIQFVCDLCSLRYSTFEILMTHNRIKHYHSIRFRCGFCNETFMNEDDLHCHFILTHRVDPYNLESSQMVHHRRSIHQTVLSEDEKQRIMTRCDCSDGESVDHEGLMVDQELDDLDEYDQLELDYNELFKQRKQSAMTQEEILELTDVFKKPAEAMCISKMHF
ncbi:zinc finger protein 611-like isoform X1 [Topomyia yanbarensis]|uniref:zinc finger protein 611-like isoform X1 n=1 Tax=Topomyia yanbarensis TaxID=2498891 RepID=UPI00273A8CE6|nr:zinc finger protein 611-like isoform X1 [Topomyia yanbarensis]